MKTIDQTKLCKVNWWLKLKELGLEYGREITIDWRGGMLTLEGCPRQFATARELYQYAAERQPAS